MYELRILSGLHRGATLPLDDQTLVMGAGDDDDVVLVDPGIEARHATLSRTDTGWLLSATNGSLLPADSNRAETLIDLKIGDFARLGKVWITIAQADARWENPPPEPQDAETIDTEDLTGAETPYAAADDTGDEPASDPGNQVEPGDMHAAHAGGRRRRSRMIYVPLALATVLSAAAAYAITAKPDEQTAARLDIRSDIKPVAKTRDGAKSLDAHVPDAAPTLTRAELREAFRKRLADADLLKRFDLTLNDDAWSMRAALDDEETRRFERILTTFMNTYKITFPVHAKVGSGELMLPFKIRQVVYGASASIVTEDGDRLYVGDEYRGVRLVAIQDNRLTFAGKRKIEVDW